MTTLVIALCIPVAAAAAGAAAGRVKQVPALFSMTAGALAGLVAATPIFFYAKAHYNERVLTCHVTGKDRTSEAGMRIYTEDCGTFVNSDSWLRGKTTSGDLYGRIQPEGVYTLRVVGWRNGFLSSFPNILDVAEGTRRPE